jgi:hypothetical protein
VAEPGWAPVGLHSAYERLLQVGAAFDQISLAAARRRCTIPCRMSVVWFCREIAVLLGAARDRPFSPSCPPYGGKRLGPGTSAAVRRWHPVVRRDTPFDRSGV